MLHEFKDAACVQLVDLKAEATLHCATSPVQALAVKNGGLERAEKPCLSHGRWIFRWGGL